MLSSGVDHQEGGARIRLEVVTLPALVPRAGAGGELIPQLTAFFTSRAIFASSAGGQLLQREGGRPHGAVVEVRRVVEAELAYRVLNLSAPLHRFH